MGEKTLGPGPVGGSPEKLLFTQMLNDVNYAAKKHDLPKGNVGGYFGGDDSLRHLWDQWLKGNWPRSWTGPSKALDHLIKFIHPADRHKVPTKEAIELAFDKARRVPVVRKKKSPSDPIAKTVAARRIKSGKLLASAPAETSVESPLLSPLSGIAVGTFLQAKGDDEKMRVFEVVRAIPSGDITQSFEGRDSDGNPVFIKSLIHKKGRFERKDAEILEKLLLRFLKEEKAIRRIKSKNVAHILGLGSKPREAGERIPFLVQQFLRGRNLEDHLKFLKRPLSAMEWFKFAKSLLEVVGCVHQSGTAHGRIRPDNVLVWEGEAYLVDFGECIFLEHYHRFPSSNREPDDPYQTPEKESSSTSADIYSVGAVLYYAATGLHPEELVESSSNRKQELFERLRTANSKLMDENVGIAHVILKCFQPDEHDRAYYTDQAVSMLDAFRSASGETETDASDQIKALANEIHENIEAACLNRIPVFSRVLENDLRWMKRRVTAALNSNYLPVRGTRDDVIQGLLEYLAGLSSEDTYITITTPTFWSHSNFGVEGRFLSQNMLLAEKGLVIRRVFLVTDDELAKQATLKIAQEVIREQQAVLDELKRKTLKTNNRNGRKSVNVDDPNLEKGGWCIRFRIVTEAQKMESFRDEESGGLTMGPKENIRLIFRADKSNGEIRALELRQETDVDETKKRMLSHLKHSLPISEFPSEDILDRSIILKLMAKTRIPKSSLV